MTSNSENANKNAHSPQSNGLLAKSGIQTILFTITVLYVISPIDAIPDVMPIIGWLDDAAIVIAEIINFLFYLKKKRAHTHPGEKDNNQI